jgi:hypothetical protein
VRPVLLAAVWLASAAGAVERSDPSDFERREAVKSATQDKLAEAMRKAPSRTLVNLGQRSVASLGRYGYRMEKTERVKGELLPAQTVDVFVREQPFAVRLKFVKGPGAGRELIYNSRSRPNAFRVRESGFLGLFGALWIDVDSSLAKSDSNHTVQEAGMAKLLARFESDLARGDQQGGYRIVHEGWAGDHIWCAVFFPPNRGRDFSAFKTRICSDLIAGLPVKVESFDAKENLLERYRFAGVQRVSKPDAFFDPENL